jgi:predicted DNA-binding protein
MVKRTTSFSLNAETLQLLKALATHLGISQTATVEVSIRTLSRREGLNNTLPLSPEPPS